MSVNNEAVEVPYQEQVAIRMARRYLRRNTGSLARILNAYNSATAEGDQRVYLSKQ